MNDFSMDWNIVAHTEAIKRSCTEEWSVTHTSPPLTFLVTLTGFSKVMSLRAIRAMEDEVSPLPRSLMTTHHRCLLSLNFSFWPLSYPSPLKKDRQHSLRLDTPSSHHVFKEWERQTTTSSLSHYTLWQLGCAVHRVGWYVQLPILGSGKALISSLHWAS